MLCPLISLINAGLTFQGHCETVVFCSGIGVSFGKFPLTRCWFWEVAREQAMMGHEKNDDLMRFHMGEAGNHPISAFKVIR